MLHVFVRLVGEDMEEIKLSIIKGMKFIDKTQMLHGEFSTYASLDINISCQKIFISTPYTTTFVLYSLDFVNDINWDSMKIKALRYLHQEMEYPGIWRFFSVNRDIRFCNGKFESYTKMGIIPDLDDTAVVSYILRKNNIDIPNNKDIFYNNKKNNGSFYTWLMDVPMRKEYTEKTPCLVPSKNDICSGVNANILLYLGENKYTAKTIEYMNDLILENKIDKSYMYFANENIVYYLISRAFYSGVRKLEISKKILVESIINQYHNNKKSFSVLNKAYAICTFMNFGVSNKLLSTFVSDIINSQNEDGSWDTEAFFIDGRYYYGSEVFTTAICLEALSRYKSTC